ncbi:UMP kinase [Candidatus Poribacteria bacterium]|nr:UMP kinase [Candidatus Poribacteria bacterium]
MNHKNPVYKRILLEISGEMMGEKDKPISPEIMQSLADQLSDLREHNIQIAIVIGAGNIWRGASNQVTMDRRKADTIGMMATVVNALALQGVLEKSGVPASVLSAINFEPEIEVDKVGPYVGSQAIQCLENGEVVVFGGGTGNPFFTTDTAAALRALQIEADVLLKATKVDGVYSSDPVENPDAEKFHSLTLEEALEKRLKVMDAAAFSLCMDNNLPIVVFALKPEGNIKKVVFGENIGTILTK